MKHKAQTLIMVVALGITIASLAISVFPANASPNVSGLKGLWPQGCQPSCSSGSGWYCIDKYTLGYYVDLFGCQLIDFDECTWCYCSPPGTADYCT